MSLSPGTRLGPYEILAPIGAGGMGEVYRAKDPRLGRDVAVKVLPEEFLEGEERKARFEREARLLAALNHPGIAAIYSFEEIPGSSPSSPGASPSRHILVMELLEGEALRSALSGAKVSTKRALEWGRQIAQGLAAAHEKGIVHRDLKPENVFVTTDGRIKILDFGLAKLTESEVGAEGTNLPTATRGTEPGVVMGTLGYMSPEQVKGQPADVRSDIFSFGAILYEMLSGQRAFHRGTAAETISAILKEDPPELSATNVSVPPGLERIVGRCLEKQPEQRFHSAADLAFDLESLSGVSGARAAATTAGKRSRPGGGRALLVAAGLAAAVLVGALAGRILFRPAPPEPPEFEVLTYSGSDDEPAVSPDGKTIAFVSSRDGTSRIWIKQVVGGAEAVLTEGPDTFPRFSPDGAWVLFVRTSPGDSSLYRVPLVGGAPRRIVGRALEGDWSPDGREIAYVTSEVREGRISASLHRVGVDGASDRTVATLPEIIFGSPRWSPDGRTVAALELPGTGTPVPRVTLFPIDGAAPRRLAGPGFSAATSFAWNGDGRSLVVLAGASGTVGRPRAAGVFLNDLRTGASRMLFSGIDYGNSVDVYGPGSLVLVTAARRSNLREIPLGSSPGPGHWLTRGGSVDRQPVYAPDGEWVAFSSNRSGNQDIWEVSTTTGAVRRLTDNPADDFDPAFSRDGKSLIFSSNRTGHFEIWMAARDGSGARRVTDDGADAENASAMPDGTWIVYASGHPEKRGIWKIRPDGTHATQLAAGPFILPEISPDGTLVSSVTVSGPSGNIGQESGGTTSILGLVRLEDGSRVPFEAVATGALSNRGRHRWTPDGRSLVFMTDDGKGLFGLVERSVVPGRDTAASRRAVAGFSPDFVTESLGISPDGTRLTVSEFQTSTGLLLATGVPDVVGRAARGADRP